VEVGRSDEDAHLMLWFGLERKGDRVKHCQKMKRMQRARLVSMRRERDMIRRHGDVSRRRGDTGERKGKRRCQLD
jgi:hypothetical protein